MLALGKLNFINLLGFGMGLWIIIGINFLNYKTINKIPNEAGKLYNQPIFLYAVLTILILNLLFAVYEKKLTIIKIAGGDVLDYKEDQVFFIMIVAAHMNAIILILVRLKNVYKFKSKIRTNEFLRK